MEKASTTLQNLIDSTEDRNLLRGILKFTERVNKYKGQTSRLSNAFHSFGSASNTSLKITATSSLKRARKGKIYVQPEAVKRRKTKKGSKVPEAKGSSVKKNPFVGLKPQRKREHDFSKNVSDNVPVSKKAGRTMSSKTKFLSPREETKKNNYFVKNFITVCIYVYSST